LGAAARASVRQDRVRKEQVHCFNRQYHIQTVGVHVLFRQHSTHLRQIADDVVFCHNNRCACCAEVKSVRTFTSFATTVTSSSLQWQFQQNFAVDVLSQLASYIVLVFFQQSGQTINLFTVNRIQLQVRILSAVHIHCDGRSIKVANL